MNLLKMGWFGADVFNQMGNVFNLWKRGMGKGNETTAT